LLAFAAQAFGQNSKFLLGTPIAGEVFACINRHDAVEVITSGEKKVLAMTMRSKIKAGVCGVISWPIVYLELIYQTKGGDDEHLTVYRGQINGKDVFVPMSGWTHIAYTI